MAKSKVLKFVGCAALAGVSYAAGRVIGFFSGVGWAAATNKTEPEVFTKATDDSIAQLKEYAPLAYKDLLKKFPKLKETDNQPED